MEVSITHSCAGLDVKAGSTFYSLCDLEHVTISFSSSLTLPVKRGNNSIYFTGIFVSL